MTPARWQQIKSILADALECDEAAARNLLVAQHCAGDGELQREVETFLAQQADGLERFASGAEAFAGPAVLNQNTGRRVGAYELVREVGRGGMGSVWLARRADNRFEQQVAIKLLKRGTDTEEVLRRFEAERRILARLDHPGIARLFDGGETDDGLPFFVMEYIDGERLTNYVQTRNLTLAARLELFRKVCAAAQFAHQNLVVHRDLKPGNILVTREGEPKLLDFGIARLLEHESDTWDVTVAADRRLTPAYASPEQVRSEPVTTASDVYALGALLYEVLTGKAAHAFAAERATSAELVRTICDGEVVRPSLAAGTRELRRQLQGDVDNIVLRAMAKAPARRYASAGHLSDDIRRFLESRPVRARPDTFAYRSATFVRRNKVGVAVASVIILTLLGGIVATTQQRLRAEKEEYKSRRLLYAAQMNLAYQAWDNANVGRAIDLLEATKPQPREEDFRGFEWHLLWRLTHERSRILAGLDTAVWRLLLSPDSQRIFASSDDGKVHVWDASTGRLEHTFAAGGPSIVLTPDGKSLLAGGRDGVARLWDVEGGRLLQSFSETSSEILAVAIAPDGQSIAAAHVDGTARLWSVTRGEVLAKLEGHSAAITSITFSPDGGAIATTSRDHTAKLWNAASGREIATLSGHSWWVLDAAFSPDGKTLATTGSDGDIRFWDVASATLSRTIRSDAGAPLDTLRFSADGKLLAAAGDDAVIQLYQTASGERVDTLRGHSGFVRSMALSPDGKTLFSGGLDGTVRIWDLATPPGAAVLHAHTDWISGIAFSPDSRTLATASKDATVKLWQSATGREMLTLAHPQWVNGVAFSPDGRELATADDDTLVRIWSAATGQPRMTLSGHNAVVECVAFSPDGRTLASGSKTGEIKLWDTISGRETASFRSQKPDLIWRLAFSPDGKKLAAAEGSASSVAAPHPVNIWDVASLRIVTSLVGHTYDVEALEFSPDGTILASGSWDGTVKLWDTHNWRSTVTLKAQRGVHSLDFSPDGRRLVTAGMDKTLKIWDVSVRQELCTLREESEIEGVAFSPDGKSLATASKDGVVRLWRIAQEERAAVDLRRPILNAPR